MGSSEYRARAWAIGRRQHSALALAQLRDAGLTRQQIRTMVETAQLDRAASKVFVASNSADTWLRGAMVATLVQPGRLWLSHRAAAHLLGFDGFTATPEIEVVGARGRRPALPPGVIHHVSNVPTRADCTSDQGIPTMNAAATLCQLASREPPARVGQALDHLLRTGASPLWLRRTAARWNESRLAGPAIVLDLLAERTDRRLPRSWFERLAKAVLDRAGVEMEHEYPLTVDGRIVASLDLANPSYRVGVECQSWERHGGASGAYRDARRKRMLRRLGWSIVEVWWWDLQRPGEIVDEVLAQFEMSQKWLVSNHFFDT